jgi:uncharacterized membrane protein YbaN (DUF454 family)
MVETGIRVFWLLAGLTSVGIGAIGVALPLLPTTPFLLIAAFAFARSSARLNNWLREHRSFGPLIEHWHRDGSIDRNVKRTAIIVMLMTPVTTWLFGAPLWIIACQIPVLIAAAVFVLSRPSPDEGHRK